MLEIGPRRDIIKATINLIESLKGDSKEEEWTLCKLILDKVKSENFNKPLFLVVYNFSSKGAYETDIN